MKSKKIIIMIVISLTIIFQIGTVQAALQANGDEPAKKDRNTWMVEIRKMETLGGTLGLQETINETDLTTQGEPNNIDIHMQKNTEYGAMALLSASSYGNPNKIENGGTTTGNATGVVIPYNPEWTAAQYTDHIGGTNYANRYINYYNITNKTTQKSGDALLETQGWHGSKFTYYYFNWRSAEHYCAGGIVRNFSNGIFSFTNDRGYWYQWSSNPHQGLAPDGSDKTTEADLSQSYTSRAVIVNGEGI